MGRKPLLLGVVLVALSVAAWLIVRAGSKDGAPVQVISNAQASAASAPEPVLDQPLTTATATRAPTVVDPLVTAPPAVEKSATAFVMRGKVVDAKRFNAADADVRLIRADGTSASTRSDAQGRFEFSIPVRPEKWESAVLWAVRGDESAFRTMGITGTRVSAPSGFLVNRPPLGDVEAGALTLQPARALKVHALQSGEAAAGAEVRVRMGAESIALWQGTTDAAGTAISPAIPSGCANVEVVRAGAAGRARAFLPEEQAVHVELTPHFAARITLVEKQSGAPIQDAEVQLEESVQVPSTPDDPRGSGMGEYSTSRPAGATATTNAEGIARFPELVAGVDYRLRVNAPGFARYPPSGSGGERVNAEKPNLTINLDRVAARTVRWPIEAGEVAAPSEGARLVLRTAPGMRSSIEAPEPDREGFVREGRVVAEAIEGRAMLLATAPDGSIASLWVDDKSDLGKPAAFRKSRTIEVSVHDDTGAPVAGASTVARNQGNNPLGPTARTDAEGRARLVNLYGDLASVYVLGPVSTGRELSAGTVDLKTGDGRVEVVIPNVAWMKARVQVHLDGVRQLPPQYQLRGSDGCKVVEELPERGELVLELGVPQKSETIELSLTAVGFLPAKVNVPVVRDGSEVAATVNLTRGATLTARVAMPRNKDRVDMQIQKWDETKQVFGMVPQYFNGLGTPNGPDGSFRFYLLGAGRYVVVESVSKITSEPVEIMPGQYAAEVDVDLSSVEWVSGRVEVADAAELLRVRVQNTTALASAPTNWLPGVQPPEGTYVAKDGTFRVRVKRGERTHLRAWHPWLAPASPGGEIDVDGGREGVVLKLIAGDSVRIAAPQLAELRGFSAARVAVYDGPVKGEPRASLYAPLVDGALRFTGVPPGRVTLWIDAGREYAPLVLSNVEIGAGVTDLGTAKFSRGSSLRIKLTVKEGQAPPRIYASARRTGPPELSRDLNSDGSAVVVLSGLEAGTYIVHYGPIMDRGGVPDRPLEFDGVNDVEVTLDLR